MQVITDVWRQDYCLCSWSDCERFGALHCWKESHVILLQNSKHLVWLWLFLLASNTGGASGTYCPPQLTVCSLNSLSLFFFAVLGVQKIRFFFIMFFYLWRICINTVDTILNILHTLWNYDLIPDPSKIFFVIFLSERWIFGCWVMGLCQAVSASLQQPVIQRDFPLSRCSAEMLFLPPPWYFCSVTLSVCRGTAAACSVCGMCSRIRDWFQLISINRFAWVLQ